VPAPLTLAVLLLLGGCKDPKYAMDTGPIDASGDGGDAADDSGTTAEDGGSADAGGTGGEITGPAVAGVVRVELYREDDNGDRSEVAWEDSEYGTDFPFGAIFVAATTTDEHGELVYWGTDTISAPTVDGDPYVLELEDIPTDGMQVYATLDLGADGILSTDEPMGVCGDEVVLASTTVARNQDIVILVPYDGGSGGSSGGGGGSDGSGGSGGSGGTGGNGGTGGSTGDGGSTTGDGGSSGSGGSSGGTGGTGDGGSGDGGSETCTSVNLSGTAFVTDEWIEGDVAVMLFEPDYAGPVAAVMDTPTVDGGGAILPYNLNVECGLGAMNLRGAWDTNLNGLIDPDDTWGAYISAPDEDGNPIVVGYEDQSPLDIQIPLGDGSAGLGLVPFVSLSGTILPPSDGFEALEEGSVIYMAALLYRPDGDIDLSTMTENAYDITSWDAGDYGSASSLPFQVWAPSNSVVYLWAYVDKGPKPNGIVNEYGEYVGSADSMTDGRVPTGTESVDSYIIELGNGS